jgi:glycosyl transferase family 25
MLIFYINLDRRPDRREFMAAQLAGLGLAGERIAALTPRELTPEQLSRFCDPVRGGRLTPVTLSCKLSHIAALEAFLATEARYGLVLEDDAILSPRLPDFLAALEADPQTIDLLRLETSLRGIRFRRIERRLAGVALVRPLSWEGGAAAYVVSRAAAEQHIRDPRMRRRNDLSLFDPFRGTMLGGLRQTDPGLCIQAHLLEPSMAPQFGSDIGGQAVPTALSLGQRRRRHLEEFVDREIVYGSRRLWHQLLGAKKHRIPFAAD